MKTAEARGAHLTPDELIARVFPVDEGPAPMPLHLAVCAECQTKVARLREGWLLDRGAVAGVVDALPETFWEGQSASVMDVVSKEAGGSSGVHPFPFSIHRSFLRRPVMAFGSLAAALVLVAGISFLRPHATVNARLAPPATQATHPPSQSTDTSDDELLRDIDHVLSEDAPYAGLIPEGVS